MSFKSDLVDIIKQNFDQSKIRYDSDLDAENLAIQYCEMLTRRITSVPREVHFSREIHDSLNALKQKERKDLRKHLVDIRQSVFLIKDHLINGNNINGFMSKNIQVSRSKDWMLWNSGMHHFHLSREFEESGFVKRSDFLLFAIITEESAYFVDVRPHNERHLWVRQNLLEIVHSNWPELMEVSVLRGVDGTNLTDEERQELRRKKIMHAADFDGKAIGPIRGGMALDGSSLQCRWIVTKLFHELDQHQEYFDCCRQNIRSNLEAKGIRLPSKIEFELVLLDSLNISEEIVEHLTGKDCLSRDLCRMGFAIVERTTRMPIAVSLRECT